jgi:hypothetical protein
MEQLVDATGVGELPEVFLNREVPDDLQDAFPDVQIDMKFRRPIQSASLRIALTRDLDELPLEPSEMRLETETLPVHGGWVEVVTPAEIGIPENFFFEFYPPKLLGPPRRKKTIVGDRLEEITIGYRTLSAVGKLLHPNG